MQTNSFHDTHSEALKALRAELQALASPAEAEHAQRFFKTGPGEYGEGDRFLGVRVPPQRKLARRYRNLPLSDLAELLASPWHEERLTGALILMLRYEKSKTAAEQETIYRFLVEHRAALNNWDLVDVIVPKTIGAYAFAQAQKGQKQEVQLLRHWAQSDNLWERRMAMLAAFAWIRAACFDLPLELAQTLLLDSEDLMHKAVGWMLREMGKRDQSVLEAFLEQHKCQMPRTMLRYAIEKFPEEQRQYYLTSSRQKPSSGKEL